MIVVSDKIKFVLINVWSFKVGTPHFGLISLAAFIRNRFSNIDIIIIESLNPLKEIIQAKPDIVGFTSDTMTFTKTVKLAKEVRKRLKIPFILGGVHITALPESFDDTFDIGVIGEGERSLREILDIFLEFKNFPKKSLEKIKGIIYKQDEKVIKNDRRELIENIDELPYPARDLTPMEEVYLKDQLNLFGVKRMATIMTSRGCPYNCVFCGSPVQWGKVRFHSPEYVIGEIKSLLEQYNIDGIMFWDDLFIAPKNRLIKLVELIKKEGLNKKLTFFGYARANLINEEICALLKSMGVKRLIFGFESGSERILSYLKGGTVKVNDNICAIKFCHKYGITISSGFIVGIPGETPEDLKKTYEFIKNNRLDNAHIYILTPYPGTDIWRDVEKLDLVSDKMDFSKLYVQLPPVSFLDFFRKSKPKIIEGRIFLNTEYKNNKKYVDLIFKMHKITFLNNLFFYLKIFLGDFDIIKRIVLLKLKNLTASKYMITG